MCAQRRFPVDPSGETLTSLLAFSPRAGGQVPSPSSVTETQKDGNWRTREEFSVGVFFFPSFCNMLRRIFNVVSLDFQTAKYNSVELLFREQRKHRPYFFI